MTVFFIKFSVSGVIGVPGIDHNCVRHEGVFSQYSLLQLLGDIGTLEDVRDSCLSRFAREFKKDR
jgi:hypothetical protein